MKAIKCSFASLLVLTILMFSGCGANQGNGYDDGYMGTTPNTRNNVIQNDRGTELGPNESIMDPMNPPTGPGVTNNMR